MRFFTLLLISLPLLVFGQKTYVPDNLFEQHLINEGIDNVLDDSVLTAAIDTLTHFHVYFADDPTGLEDFSSLTSMIIQNNLPMDTLDLSAFPNLNSLEWLECRNRVSFIRLPLSTVLDSFLYQLLTYAGPFLDSLHLPMPYPNLKTVFLEDSDIQQIDISECPLLEYLTIVSNAASPTGALSSLDVSQNLNLKMLGLARQPLDSLDVSNNLELKILGINYTATASLNLLNNNNLEYLSCNYNQLTDIVFPEEGAQLQYLDCIGNHLTEIDLGILPNLYWLNCGDNELVAINVSLNTVLELFVCANNLLTCLDLSQNPKLTTVICNDNDLSYLNVQNGFNDSLMQFWALNNNLSCIQVDNVTFFDTSFAPSIFVDSAVVYSTNCNYQDSCTASSLEEQLVEQESMLVYPNPVQEQLYVSVAEQARLKLFSLNGQLLKEEALHYGTHAVHVSDLAAGVYFYELQGSNTDERGKLIIAR